MLQQVTCLYSMLLFHRSPKLRRPKTQTAILITVDRVVQVDQQERDLQVEIETVQMLVDEQMT